MDEDEAEFKRRVEIELNRIPLLRAWQELQSADPMPRRSFVVEFAGMPKAGKSGAIETVRHFFSHAYRVASIPGQHPRPFNYHVHTPAEGVSLRTPQLLKRDPFDFNTWAGAYGLQQMLQAAHDDYNDLVILARGPWDAGCWLDHHLKLVATPRRGDPGVTARFFQDDQWMTRSDLHVVLVVSPEEAAKRERQTRLIEHGGFASNTREMAAIRDIYESRFGNLKAAKAAECGRVGELAAILIDTTTMQHRSVAIEIITRIFDVLDAKLTLGEKEFMFDEDWLLARIGGYVGHVRGKRSAVLGWLPQYVKDANALSAPQRSRLAEGIDRHRAPQEMLLGARAPDQDEQLKNRLAQLLDEVRQR
jgi:hypothetical protein